MFARTVTTHIPEDRHGADIQLALGSLHEVRLWTDGAARRQMVGGQVAVERQAQTEKMKELNMPTMNDLAAAEADIKRMETEIARLQEAKRMAGKIADERSNENVELRNASLIMEGELRDQIRQLREVLKGIAEYCSMDGRKLGPIARLPDSRLMAVRNTAEQALRVHEQSTSKED